MAARPGLRSRLRGGGGIPTMYRPGTQTLVGVEAVIDKGPRELRACQGPSCRHPGHRHRHRRRVPRLGHRAPAPDPGGPPDELSHLWFPAGSMGPKVQAAADFARTTGKEAVIGALNDLSQILKGTVGTRVSMTMTLSPGESRLYMPPCTSMAVELGSRCPGRCRNGWERPRPSVTQNTCRKRVGLCNTFDDEAQEPLLVRSTLKIRPEVAEVGRRLGAGEPVERDEQVRSQESGHAFNDSTAAEPHRLLPSHLWA